MAAPAPGPIPKDAIEFLRRKKLRPEFDHRDVWAELHATHFTVAKMLQADLLKEVQDSLVKALEEGQTFRTWSNSIRPQLEKAGWWGVMPVEDPLADETKLAQLGSPRRLRTIYRVNTRQARAAGQWQRIQRSKRAMPYLIYELGPSEEHRPEHVAWHGTILPVDHPWWDTHTPMNGWGCKCRIRQISERERDRLMDQGVPDQGTAERDADGLPTGRRIRGSVPAKTLAPPLRERTWKNPRTGASERIPAGIDPGFQSNPGKIFRTDQHSRAFMRKLPGLPADIGSQAYELVKDRVGPVVRRDFEALVESVRNQVDAKEFRPENRALVLGALTPRQVLAITEQTGAAPKSAAVMVRDVEFMHLWRDAKATSTTAAGKPKSAAIEDLAALPDAIDQPRAILLDARSKTLLYAFEPAGRQREAGKFVVGVDLRLKTQDGKVVTNGLRTASLVDSVDLKKDVASGVLTLIEGEL